MRLHDDIVDEIVRLRQANEDFRREIVTGKHSQVDLMSTAPGEHIG